MKLSTLVAASCIGAAYSKQCFGYTPMSSISTYLGADISYETSNRICCNNHRFAEYSGYLDAPEVDLFGRLDPSNETVFYNSVCGLPHVIAPRGRSFDDFKKESLHMVGHRSVRRKSFLKMSSSSFIMMVESNHVV
jgi:hypothetical protein